MTQDLTQHLQSALESFERDTIRSLFSAEVNTARGLKQAYSNRRDLGIFETIVYLDPQIFLSCQKYLIQPELKEMFSSLIGEFNSGLKLRMAKARRLNNKDYKVFQDYPVDKHGRKSSAQQTQILKFDSSIEDIYILFREIPCYFIIYAYNKESNSRIFIHGSGALYEEVLAMKNEFEESINTPMKHPQISSKEEWTMLGHDESTYNDYSKSLERTSTPSAPAPRGAFFAQWSSLNYKNTQ